MVIYVCMFVIDVYVYLSHYFVSALLEAQDVFGLDFDPKEFDQYASDGLGLEDEEHDDDDEEEEEEEEEKEDDDLACVSTCILQSWREENVCCEQNKWCL